MDLVLDIASWFCLVSGAILAVIGGIGMIRLPDLFSRMHAAGVADTLAVALIVVGMMLQAGFGLNFAKLVLILAFIFFTSPTATHAVAKAALHGGEKPRVAKTTAKKEPRSSKT